MSLTIAAAIVGVFYFADDSATNAAVTHPPAEAAGQAAAEAPESMEQAEDFLKFIDAGDWQGSWDASGAFFQSQTSAEQWASIVEPVREQVGEAQTRTLATVERTSMLPGAPEGEYEVLQFNTEFSGVEGPAVETLIMLQQGDSWGVAGYFVRPGTL